MVLGVVVVITGATVLHLSSPTPLHPFHPLLGRAGQDRLSEHRHLGPQGTQGGARHDDGLGEMAYRGVACLLGNQHEKINKILGSPCPARPQPYQHFGPPCI